MQLSVISKITYRFSKLLNIFIKGIDESLLFLFINKKTLKQARRVMKESPNFDKSHCEDMR